MTENGNPFDDAPVIHRYTRAQAIEDGMLIDLTAWAKETGFKFPVACTSAVWNQYVVPPPTTVELGQSERGRLHDVLWMLFLAIRKSGGGDELRFKVIFLQSPKRQETVTLKALCGPGDEGEPVLTVLNLDES